MDEAKRRKQAGLGPRPRPFDMKSAVQSVIVAARASGGVRSTTPLFPLSVPVKSLCAATSPQEPILLPFTDVGHSYRPGHCHSNVRHYTRENGGEVVGGWLVWENPGYAELEGHAIWRNPAGTLVDVTPRQDGEELILFLLDPNVKIVILADRQIIPSNRSSIPGCPYLCASRPIAHATVEAIYDEVTRNEMLRLGVLPLH